jgi:hypothetical protein
MSVPVSLVRWVHNYILCMIRYKVLRMHIYDMAFSTTQYPMILTFILLPAVRSCSISLFPPLAISHRSTFILDAFPHSPSGFSL